MNVVNNSSFQSTAAPASKAVKNSPISADQLTAEINKGDPDKVKAFYAEQDKLSQILNQLKSSKTTLSQQNKAAAQQKIARLKAEIQALHMMGGLNPKATAREAARLAKELADAVKEYAAASGDSSGGSAAPDAATAGGASPAPAAVSSANNAAAVTATAPNANTQNAASDPANPAAAQAVASNQTSSYRTTATAANNQNSADQDKTFADEARRLKDELKSIIQMAKHKLEQKTHSGFNPDIQRAEKALADTNDSLNKFAAPSVNIRT